MDLYSPECHMNDTHFSATMCIKFYTCIYETMLLVSDDNSQSEVTDKGSFSLSICCVMESKSMDQEHLQNRI